MCKLHRPFYCIKVTAILPFKLYRDADFMTYFFPRLLCSVMQTFLINLSSARTIHIRNRISATTMLAGGPVPYWPKTSTDTA